MGRRRRRWWVYLLVPVLLVALAVGTFFGWLLWSYVTSDIDTVGEVTFDRPLAVPPLAESTIGPDGRRTFDLTLQRGETDLGRDEPTATWGVNGAHLGPTIRTEVGERVRVRVTNELGEASTLHWHGMHLPARMDGGPHQMIAHGATWEPSWTVDQQPATLWYHPHLHGRTAEHVYRGVAGMWLVDDPEQRVDLPRTYGVDDFPVIVQDRQFDGSELDLDRGLFESGGLVGDTVLVNGTPGPYLDVTTERVRLRLLNASNTRSYTFHLAAPEGDLPFQVVGSDGGLLPNPVELTRLELTPGERAEVVVALEPGQDAVLRSAPSATDRNRFTGDADRLDVMELRAADRLAPSPEVPAELAEPPDLAEDRVVVTRELRLTGTTINGRSMDLQRVDTVVRLGTTERWVVRNSDGQRHNFHVHDVQFQVESVDGEPPPPELAGWKDTVGLPPGAEVALLLRFTDHADPDWPYMYHCHLLYHEDQGMMGQLVVLRPGQQVGEVPTSGGHEH